MAQWVKNLTAVAWVTAEAQIVYMAWEFPYAANVANKKRYTSSMVAQTKITVT